MSTYLYFNPVAQTAALFEDGRFEGFTERHKARLPSVGKSMTVEDPISTARQEHAVGLVIAVNQGWPGRSILRLSRKALRAGLTVFFYWPAETAVEVVDVERLESFWRHWWFINAYRIPRRIGQSGVALAKRVLSPVINPIRRRFKTMPAPVAASSITDTNSSPQINHDRIMADLDALIRNAAPLPWGQESVSSANPIPGVGVYLRTDFWAPITSGGSYGHTCYVAESLARVTDHLVAFMANEFPLLNDLGVSQVVLDVPGDDCSELTLLIGTDHYHQRLYYAIAALKPAYIYERLCLGNFVGAKLSQEFGIPYIVEYNGSEISMKRSFDSSPYEYEALYMKAEDAAFAQASLINVISDAVRDDLVGRGVDQSKILVNPNGANPNVYSPPDDDDKALVRKSLGLDKRDVVIGFTGTFGGWHGVDVLAEALPKIFERAPNARMLLIGSGHFKYLVDDVVNLNALGDRVISVGRVPQSEGARLLRACDIFVSPHNAHMVDSRFFGSPTKIFEYMSMAGGIVASDLEQIGEVLSPALRANDVCNSNGIPNVTNERSMLCKPGDVDEFVDAVVFLCNHPEISSQLGNNARQAVLDFYSWDRHVERLWPSLRSGVKTNAGLEDLTNGMGANAAPIPPRHLDTGDDYKDEVQNQWNNDACGSHYVKNAQLNTLAWYEEAEAYRYGTYAPWMLEVMEFDKHRGDRVLEIGGGMGTDLSQFARNGARVTDIDLSAGHLAHAQENFRLRGLDGEFVYHDAESLPFADGTFDVVYSNGVIHHTPNTASVVREIHRVLKPGGKAIIMVYAENSLHYWRNLVRDIGIYDEQLLHWSMGEIMSRSVEISENNARPLVKVYTPKRLRGLFREFRDIEIVQRQFVEAEHPIQLKWLSLRSVEKLMGWNLIIKATKPK